MRWSPLCVTVLSLMCVRPTVALAKGNFRSASTLSTLPRVETQAKRALTLGMGVNIGTGSRSGSRAGMGTRTRRRRTNCILFGQCQSRRRKRTTTGVTLKASTKFNLGSGIPAAVHAAVPVSPGS